MQQAVVRRDVTLGHAAVRLTVSCGYEHLQFGGKQHVERNRSPTRDTALLAQSPR